MEQSIEKNALLENSYKNSKPKFLNLKDFTFGEILGTGSFARVKLSEDIHSKNYYAIKIMKKEELIKLGQVDHIMSEMKIMNYLKHPFIVRLEGYMQDAKYIYMVEEFINGGELFTILRAYGKMDMNMARFYSGHIVLIFEYMHLLNLIYRDLKPENVLLDRSGYLKLTDFGFAKYCEHRTYTICGTPEYLAPEILLNKGHGKSVDWWTFGVFLYELIAGYDPFSDDDPMKVYEKILAGKLKFSKTFDSDAKSLVKKLLKIDLSKRYGNIADGIKKIKKHKFFTDFDFDMLLNQELKPPYLPRVTSDKDVSNFPVYPEFKKEMVANIPGIDPFWDWFK